MPYSRALENIGRRLREASRDIGEEKLPEQWSTLIGRLAKLEQPQKSGSMAQADRHRSRPQGSWRREKKLVCF
jgi:hypothetical protein